MRLSSRRIDGRFRRRCLRASLAAGMALLALGCRPDAEPRQLRIGFIVPLSGPLAPYGGSHLEGARLAADQLNRDGGVSVKDGRARVVLVEKDGGSSPESAVAAAQELISRDRVAVIIGPIFSSQALPVARLADRAGIPMIDQIATNPAVTRGTSSVYRISCTDDFQGEAMARFCRERLGARRAAVLYDVASDYNRGVAEIFSRSFTQRGGRIVAFETYTTGDADFRAQLRRAGAARPDVLFLPNYPNEIQPQVSQLRELGLHVPVVGSDAMSWNDRAYARVIEGAWYSVHFTPDDPGRLTAAFVDACRAAYREDPDQGVALSYDAVRLVAEVVTRQRSPEARAILTGLGTLDTWEGVTGPMIFRGSHDPAKGLDVVRMVDGKPRFEARLEP